MRKSAARKIVDKFGGCYQAASALRDVTDRHVSTSTVSRWRETGDVPSRWHRRLAQAARLRGVKLKASDFLNDEVLDELS